MEKSTPADIQTFDVPLSGSYRLEMPQDPPFIAVALHGYGQTAELFGNYARRLLGPDPAIAAIEGPHPQYLDRLPSGRIGYHWGTSADWPAAIALHHRILLRVLDNLPNLPILLLGFSQPVGLNYRFLATHVGRVQGAIALCGGVPQEWAPPTKLNTPIFHVARSEDEYYRPETAIDFETRLRRHATDIDFRVIPGKHRFPSNGREIVKPWVERVFHHDIGLAVPA
jgi:predicted esterase